MKYNIIAIILNFTGNRLKRSGAIIYGERASTAERKPVYPSGGAGFNFGRMFRVFFLVLATGLLSWYAKTGVNPLGGVDIIRVEGAAGGGYAVRCLNVTWRGDTSEVGALAVPGALPADGGALPSHGGASWEAVRPFADSATAVLLTFQRATALICDSSALAPRAGGAPSRFREKVDLLVVPPASEGGVLEARGLFRPRLVAAVPPCSAPPNQNIACAAAGRGEAFRYDFRVSGSRLKLAGGAD